MKLGVIKERRGQLPVETRVISLEETGIHDIGWSDGVGLGWIIQEFIERARVRSGGETFVITFSEAEREKLRGVAISLFGSEHEAARALSLAVLDLQVNGNRHKYHGSPPVATTISVNGNQELAVVFCSYMHGCNIDSQGAVDMNSSVMVLGSGSFGNPPEPRRMEAPAVTA